MANSGLPAKLAIRSCNGPKTKFSWVSISFQPKIKGLIILSFLCKHYIWENLASQFIGQNALDQSDRKNFLSLISLEGFFAWRYSTRRSSICDYFRLGLSRHAQSHQDLPRCECLSLFHIDGYCWIFKIQYIELKHIYIYIYIYIYYIYGYFDIP